MLVPTAPAVDSRRTAGYQPTALGAASRLGSLTTAATITVVGEPGGLCARRELAANAREPLAAANKSQRQGQLRGDRTSTTVDPRLRDGAPEPAGPASRRPQNQSQVEGSLCPAAPDGCRCTHPDPVAPNVYAVDLATLRFVAEARHLTSRSTPGDPGVRAVGGPAWLRRFVQHMNGESRDQCPAGRSLSASARSTATGFLSWCVRRFPPRSLRHSVSSLPARRPAMYPRTRPRIRPRSRPRHSSCRPSSGATGSISAR